jgi:hypothetical protein
MGGRRHPGDLSVLWYCVLVIRAWTYEYAQGLMSIRVYCVLVVRAWTYEYGLTQMYVGGFFTGNRPPVFPPRRFTIPPMYHERGLNSSEG